MRASSWARWQYALRQFLPAVALSCHPKWENLGPRLFRVPRPRGVPRVGLTQEINVRNVLGCKARKRRLRPRSAVNDPNTPVHTAQTLFKYPFSPFAAALSR